MIALALLFLLAAVAFIAYAEGHHAGRCAVLHQLAAERSEREHTATWFRADVQRQVLETWAEAERRLAHLQRRFRAVLAEARRWKRAARGLSGPASRVPALEAAWHRALSDLRCVRADVARLTRDLEAHRLRAQRAKSAEGVMRGERDREHNERLTAEARARQAEATVRDLRSDAAAVLGDGTERVTTERAQALLDHPYTAHCGDCGSRLHCEQGFDPDHDGEHARVQRDVHDLTHDLIAARARGAR